MGLTHDVHHIEGLGDGRWQVESGEETTAQG
jgi:hypothetical protein